MSHVVLCKTYAAYLWSQEKPLCAGALKMQKNAEKSKTCVE